jgi:hypothetical protein
MPKNHLKRDPAERLGELLDQSLSRLALGPQLQAYGIWAIWNDVVGRPVARNAQPEKIRAGTLFIKVSSPVWMQQLQFMKDLIAEKINQRLRAEVVKNIFFFVGSIAPPDSEAEPEPPPAPVDNADPVDEGFLASLEDPEIRQAFKKLLRSYARRNKSLR